MFEDFLVGGVGGSESLGFLELFSFREITCAAGNRISLRGESFFDAEILFSSSEGMRNRVFARGGLPRVGLVCLALRVFFNDILTAGDCETTEDGVVSRL